MTDAAQPWIDALHASHERLGELVRGLDADAVRGPSYAKEWTIADVLSHLGSGAEIDRLRIRAAVGHTEPPGAPECQPIWDRWNAKTPQAQAADVIPADAADLAALDALTATERGGAHVEMFGGSYDLAGLVALRLGEHALHTWDVAVMLEPTAVVSADAVALLAETTLTRTAAWWAQPTGATFVLAVETTAGRRFTLSATAEAVTLVSGDADGSTSGTLRLTDEQLVRLAYGRLTDADDVHLVGASRDAVVGLFAGR